ncbi:hypothetical protein MCOR25_007531 [Pyricularia grisea]|nr:hypothetical protein MCOR25_007531 [Pyricularia grisea]
MELEADRRKQARVQLGRHQAIQLESDKDDHSVVVPSPRHCCLFCGGKIPKVARDGNIGIGGFLTGDGKSFHTAKYGFGCDNIINAEVVLAVGRIVNVNKDGNVDLFKALKGGWGKFGIVTRFDLFTFPSLPIWGGARFVAVPQIAAVADSMVNFTTSYSKHHGAAYLLNWTYIFSMGRPTCSSNILGKLVDTYVLPPGKYNVWYTPTFANDARIINKAADLNSTFVSDLIKVVPADQLGTEMLFQPMPKFFFENGLERGGNIMGMGRADGGSLPWLLACTVETAEQEKFLHERSAKFKDEIAAYANSMRSLREWQYINYVDPTQGPVDSYGPANVAFLKLVSSQYDPTGFFQKQQGGFIMLPQA